jgi:hypothetical protein
VAELTKEQKDRVKRGQNWRCAKCGRSIKSGGQIHDKNGDELNETDKCAMVLSRYTGQDYLVAVSRSDLVFPHIKKFLAEAVWGRVHETMKSGDGKIPGMVATDQVGVIGCLQVLCQHALTTTISIATVTVP